MCALSQQDGRQMRDLWIDKKLQLGRTYFLVHHLGDIFVLHLEPNMKTKTIISLYFTTFFSFFR